MYQPGEGLHLQRRDGTLTMAQIDFATASILLYADGKSYISFGDGDGNVDRDPHVTLGAATDSACESEGIWHRDFANGSVSVDPVAGTTGDIGHGAPHCTGR